MWSERSLYLVPVDESQSTTTATIEVRDDIKSPIFPDYSELLGTSSIDLSIAFENPDEPIGMWVELNDSSNQRKYTRDTKKEQTTILYSTKGNGGEEEQSVGSDSPSLDLLRFDSSHRQSPDSRIHQPSMTTPPTSSPDLSSPSTPKKCPPGLDIQAAFPSYSNSPSSLHHLSPPLTLRPPNSPPAVVNPIPPRPVRSCSLSSGICEPPSLHYSGCKRHNSSEYSHSPHSPLDDHQQDSWTSGPYRDSFNSGMASDGDATWDRSTGDVSVIGDLSNGSVDVPLGHNIKMSEPLPQVHVTFLFRSFGDLKDASGGDSHCQDSYGFTIDPNMEETWLNWKKKKEYISKALD